MSFLRRQPPDHRDAKSIRRNAEARTRGELFVALHRPREIQSVRHERDRRRAHPTPQPAFESARGRGHAAGEIRQHAGDDLVQPHRQRAARIAVKRRHHRNARAHTRGQRDEERLEIVRMQEAHAVLARPRCDRRSAAKIEPPRALESHRGQPVPPRFLGQRIGGTRPLQRADHSLVRRLRGLREREHRAVRTVQRRALPEMEDANHARAASSR